MISFEFATAGRILFGEGKRAELPTAARRFGSRALLVTGGSVQRAAWARDALLQAEVEVSLAFFGSEPRIAEVQAASAQARAFGAEMVLAVGGGSVIDAGKAIAAMATNPGSILDYLEVIGAGKPLVSDPLPVIAVPTTAGTGAEVTRNAVLASPEHELKVSLRSPRMLPALAIVDPELTLDLPPRLTAATGMDALTQLIEPFVCTRANPLVDGLCREGIPLVAGAIEKACRTGRDREARGRMALGSLFGGLALANSGLGAVHGFAAPIGGLFSAPHGAVCAALLPHVMEANFREVLRGRNETVATRFQELAQLLTGRAGAAAEDGVHWVQNLTAKLQIPPLSTWGLRSEHIPVICERAENASSMKANPVRLSREQLEQILAAAL